MQGIQGQITWVYTHDLETSAGFYRDMLRLPVSRDAGTAVIFETTPNAFVGVCEVFGDRTVEPEGGMITFLVDTKDQVDDRFAQLKARGVALGKAPQELDQFGIYSFFCTDPNGYVIEIQTFLK
ncbi:Catechol 2,3-dioxygenase [Shimia gijangensis]|uniref:Catechol 2,3-dioxygenase n=1 Tax=Shimia gijangensis TaxID=1470563 RepID=A0A1M6ASB5_9RHOB|nr:VOC family protein [Shimia gijangensis]SHI39365.1 Catechol 2,3-dioxygenase [Shimia gijangensis]